MRKGRLELWLGGGCVLLLAALALGGYYRRDLQAAWYRWRFLHGEKSGCEEALEKLAKLDPESDRYSHDLYVENPEDLEVVKRVSNKLTVRNDRGSRLCVGATPGLPTSSLALLAFLNGRPAPSGRREAHRKAVKFLMQRCDGGSTYLPAASDNGTEGAVALALRWLKQHEEATRLFWPQIVLDPGEKAEFRTWPQTAETPPK